MHPLIGIAIGCDEKDVRTRRTYIDAVVRSGGTPILLPPVTAHLPAIIAQHASICDAFIFTGGNDPAVEHFNQKTHPSAKLENPDRQRFDEALLRELNHHHPDKPILAICWGMQLLALMSGGRLNQHLPDDTPTAADHMDDRIHAIRMTAENPFLIPGSVTSWHHQAVSNPGSLRTIAVAHDNIIEAIDDPARPFVLGVQWHPERSGDGPLGIALFHKLIDAARASTSTCGRRPTT